jgi:hypothetical protein
MSSLRTTTWACCRRPRRRAPPPDDGEGTVLQYTSRPHPSLPVSQVGIEDFSRGNGGGNRKSEVTPHVSLLRTAARISPSPTISRPISRWHDVADFHRAPLTLEKLSI